MQEGQPIAILVVDDEPAVLALVRHYLGDARVMLIEASNGMDALEQIMVGPDLDLLITDLQMPEMEGTALARQVRKVEPNVKVLYLTGHADRLFEGTPQLAAGEAYLDKPFAREGLREAVALLLFGRLRL